MYRQPSWKISFTAPDSWESIRLRESSPPQWKTTIFLTNMDDFATVNEVYQSYFDGQYPARSCVQVAKLPLGGLVEVECVAFL